MTREAITDISPDGVRIVVEWPKFLPGTSVFIPAINTTKAVSHLLKATRLARGDIAKRVCVENGKYGVRVWRLS